MQEELLDAIEDGALTSEEALQVVQAVEEAIAQGLIDPEKAKEMVDIRRSCFLRHLSLIKRSETKNGIVSRSFRAVKGVL